MRGEDRPSGALFSYVDIEARIPTKHPLRAMRRLTNAALSDLDRAFSGFTRPADVRPFRRSGCCGRRFCSFSIRSAGAATGRTAGVRSAVSLVRRAVDRREGFRRLDILQEPRPPSHSGDRARVSVFAARPAGGEGAFERGAFFRRRTLLKAWASMKSFRPRDGSGEPPSPGRNSEADFRKTKRSNETHASTTDLDARLFRKGDGQESRLSYLGHALMENRNGLVVAAEATWATGTAEREAAARLSERSPEGATLGADKTTTPRPSSRG